MPQRRWTWPSTVSADQGSLPIVPSLDLRAGRIARAEPVRDYNQTPPEQALSTGLCRTGAQAGKRKGPPLSRRALQLTPGGVLLSHTVSRAVPSALEGLTSLFGMGRGVSPPL